MNGRNGTLRWIVIGIVTLLAIAGGFFVALRPISRMRVRREELPAREPDVVERTSDPQQVTYVDGDGSAIAPTDFPVKVNQRSGIYHLPGDLAYDRTVSTRNYTTSEAAEADGFRHARR